jgi:NAD(P)-dependent dehydrogenase (short-subunit alcohol dehydrogenase family)
MLGMADPGHRFQDQVAIVTGGGGEFGLATAMRMGREGARVILVELDREAGERAADQLDAEGIDGRLLIGDVAEPEAAKWAVNTATMVWGRLDIVVNNAYAGGEFGTVWEVGIDTFDISYRVNMRAPMLFCKEAIPKMKERNYGRIVNIASIAGKEGNPKRAAYSSTKAGLIAITKSVGVSVADTGIRVNAVAPSVAFTKPVREATAEERDYMVAKIPTGRPAEVSEVVSTICWAASPECSFTNGAVFDVTGGRATY